MNIEERIAELFRIRDTRKVEGRGWMDNAYAYWKDGFNELIAGNNLTLKKVDEFCQERKNHFPKFLRFVGNDFYHGSEKEQIGNFYDLPVNNEHHLQFPLVYMGDTGRFVFISYKENHDDKIIQLPMIHMKRSLPVDFPNVKYDIVEPWHQTPELVRQSYELFKQLIDHAKV
ncbi:MAG: hypothetical protein Q7S56_00155 [Nanoarchaeota archaeon]|nr:hypothetical protein [Nanoarchaeota archaeon]